MSTQGAGAPEEPEVPQHPHRVIATTALTALVIALLLFTLRSCEAITGSSPIPGPKCTVTASPSGSPSGSPGPSGSGGGATASPTMGPTGPAGPSGATGAEGSPGPSGATGAVGPTGPSGEPGTCTQGETGPAGTDGTDGASAYQVWLDLGNMGSELDFIDSLIGAEGPIGETGPAGADGAPGVDGAPGADGADGAVGASAYQVWLDLGNSGTEADFIASLVGAQGPQGIQGLQGIQGVQGDPGPTGPPGTSGLGYYGSFFDTTTQPNIVPDTANAMTYDTTDSSNGVSITSGSHITFAHPGVYNIAFSAQLERTQGGSSAQVDIWLSKNGTMVDTTDTQVSLQAGAQRLVAAWNFFVTVTAPGDYYELMWSSNTPYANILYLPPQTGPDRPAIPSVIVTVNQVQ